MIGEWVKLTLLSTSSLFGVYIVFGVLMHFLEQLNTKIIFSAFGTIGIILTGFIGTVVHEFSHFLMCLIFRHEVVEVVWFRPLGAMEDGVLGYVQHRYDPNSLYQQVGNFFIGIAPLLLGAVFILIIYRICLPKSAKQYTAGLNENMKALANSFTTGSILKILLKQNGQLLKSLFTKENMKKPIFWLFLLVMYSISSHMSLSTADLRGALMGLIILLAAVVVISFILALLHLPVKKCAGLLIRYNALLISIFSMAVGFSLLTLGFSALLDLVF